MVETKPCAAFDEKTGLRCSDTMTHNDLLRYPGQGAIGRGLNEPLNLQSPEYGPGCQCNKSGHIEPDRGTTLQPGSPPNCDGVIWICRSPTLQTDTNVCRRVAA